VVEGQKNERRTACYSGRVQGVGFRYTACGIADRYDVTGYVQNLDDGRVCLVAEGQPNELDRFLAAVAEMLERYIRHVDVTTGPATDEFDRFGIEM
jgi:acylphosphatase